MSPKLSTMVANSIVPRMLSSVGVGEPVCTGTIYDGQARANRPSSIDSADQSARIKYGCPGAGFEQRVEELVKTTKGLMEKIDAVAEATAKNGNLDRATVDAALDRLLRAMKSVNDELDELLAKARR